jgi:hypothetical protein
VVKLPGDLRAGRGGGLGAGETGLELGTRSWWWRWWRWTLRWWRWWTRSWWRWWTRRWSWWWAWRGLPRTSRTPHWGRRGQEGPGMDQGLKAKATPAQPPKDSLCGQPYSHRQAGSAALRGSRCIISCEKSVGPTVDCFTDCPHRDTPPRPETAGSVPPPSPGLPRQQHILPAFLLVFNPVIKANDPVISLSPNHVLCWNEMLSSTND